MTYRPAQLPGSVLSIPGLSGPALPASSWLAANADRERAVDVLRAGFAEGRLTQDEYNERVARAYASRTYGELADLTADLPAGPVPAGIMPTAFTGPLAARPGAALSSPASILGLVLTAVVVFTLAALITGVAFYVHMHTGVHPFSRPFGPTFFMPKVTRLH